MTPLALALVAALGLLSAVPVAAQSPADVGVRLLLEGGIEMGGDRIIELQFTDGSTQTLTAGQGGSIGAGLQWRPSSLPRFSAAATLGVKFVSNASNNASIGITRVPLKLSGRWALDRDWAIGAGVVRHAAIHVEGDGFFADQRLTSSSGLQLELVWRTVALTYTGLTYTTAAGEAFDAGSVGVGVRWVARGRASAKR